MDAKEQLLDDIIEAELAMFLATPNEGGVASCQERPDVFRVMRKMAHCVHKMEFLRSWLDDLRRAKLDGRNLMLEKYARMDDLLPPISENPLLDRIADMETEFLIDAIPRSNGMIRPESVNGFRRYLRSELETMSDATLAFYAAEIEEAKKAGVNPVLQRHEWLAARLAESANPD